LNHLRVFIANLLNWRLAVIALPLLAAAYIWYGYRYPSWTEEVLLPDGRSITVQQRRDFVDGYGTRKTWLTFGLPELGGEQTWAESLYPSMIAASEGRVFVVGRPRGSRQFSAYSHPKYVYVAFEWREGRFQRIPFLSVPEELRKQENVRWCLPGGADSRESVKPDGWCIDRIGESRFPISRTVELSALQAEAAFWAGLSGHKPGSD